jgi:hypothetical protein
MDTFIKYKKKIDLAILNGCNYTSKITNEIRYMEGMTGAITRNFYNNLLNMPDARYLEVGCWKGSSVCSAMCGNEADIVCIDNFSEFEGTRDILLNNINNFRGLNKVRFIESNCFDVDIRTLPKFNIYMYDGDHSRECHHKALVHFYPCMDDIFIYIVDDWNWEHVRDGVNDSFKELNVTELYSREIFTEGNGIQPTWWNGIYIGILMKNKD